MIVALEVCVSRRIKLIACSVNFSRYVLYIMHDLNTSKKPPALGLKSEVYAGDL